MAKNNKPVLDGGQSAAGAKNQANFKTPTSGGPVSQPAWVNSPSSGAWANYNKKKKQEGLPDWYQNEYEGYMGTTTAADISNPNVPVSAITLDNTPKSVQTRINYGASNLGTSDVKYQQPGIPNPAATHRPPAYGGSYNPTSTNTAWSPPTWLRPRQDTPDPATMVNEYVGTPVDTSLSDTLRGITPLAPTPPPFQTPVGIGFTAARPFNYRPPSSGGGYGGGYSNSGFGSSYGGNWSGGGGGGGWNDYGDGYGDRPAWMNYLQNLYSWNIK